MAGIKETKDVIKFIGALGVAIIREVRDGGGVELEDIGDLLSNQHVLDALQQAMDGGSLILGELQDVSVFEGIALGQAAYSDILNPILDALKEPVPLRPEAA